MYSTLSTDTPNQDAATAAAAAVDSQQDNIAQIKKLSFKEWKRFQKLDKCSVAAAMELECDETDETICTCCYDTEDYLYKNILFNDDIELFNDEEYMMEYMEKHME